MITPAALAVLSGCSCVERSVKLPPDQLERTLYEEVNEVLVRLGGKWKSNKKAHVFEFYDPQPLLSAVLATGEMPPKNPTAFFPTPATLVEKIIGWLKTEDLEEDGVRCLEPSAGTGAIADALRLTFPGWEIDCCEILEINRSILKGKGLNVVADDFTSYEPDHRYDVVVMNPPFSVEGDSLAYITHVQKAWGLLNEDGVLVAIAPPTWQTRGDAKSKAFREIVLTYGEFHEVEAGTFKESGTMVATVVIWCKKQDASWKLNPYDGYPSWYCWMVDLHASNDQRFHKQRAEIAALPADRITQAIRAYYETVSEAVKKDGDWVALSNADHAFLLRALCEEFEIEEPAPLGQFEMDLVVSA